MHLAHHTVHIDMVLHLLQQRLRQVKTCWFVVRFSECDHPCGCPGDRPVDQLHDFQHVALCCTVLHFKNFACCTIHQLRLQICAIRRILHVKTAFNTYQSMQNRLHAVLYCTMLHYIRYSQAHIVFIHFSLQKSLSAGPAGSRASCSATTSLISLTGTRRAAAILMISSLLNGCLRLGC
jgi:hypothetical protein